MSMPLKSKTITKKEPNAMEFVATNNPNWQTSCWPSNSEFNAIWKQLHWHQDWWTLMFFATPIGSWRLFSSGLKNSLAMVLKCPTKVSKCQHDWALVQWQKLCATFVETVCQSSKQQRPWMWSMPSHFMTVVTKWPKTVKSDESLMKMMSLHKLPHFACLMLFCWNDSHVLQLFTFFSSKNDRSTLSSQWFPPSMPQLCKGQSATISLADSLSKPCWFEWLANVHGSLNCLVADVAAAFLLGLRNASMLVWKAECQVFYLQQDKPGCLNIPNCCTGTT